VLDSQGFVPVPITFVHGQAAGALPGPLKDPFDRMLIAQAMLDRMVLVSNERGFGTYGVRRLW
jgi:PIN domain nuclease of toxin-antitoxin system